MSAEQWHLFDETLSEDKASLLAQLEQLQDKDDQAKAPSGSCFAEISSIERELADMTSDEHLARRQRAMERRAWLFAGSEF
jgi:hypothetical protein